MELHRSATYNMRYKSERWQHGVFPLAKQVEILALQEVPDSLPPDVVLEGGRQVGPLTNTNGFTVERYRWVNCRPPNPQSPCIIYRVTTHRRNRSIAIVVNQQGDGVSAVNVIPPQSPAPDAKPTLGIELADGTWFYSVHARNRVGEAQDNDAPALVGAIAGVGGDHWAALGDFNRTPDSWPRLSQGQFMVRTGSPTYPVQLPRAELDYMIVKGLSSALNYTAHRLTYVDGSDHYPVGFWYSPSGGIDYSCDPGDNLLRARQDKCARKAAIVSMGDSYISGEAGRWAGNGDTLPGGTVFGTDRAATNCFNEHFCGHDLDRVYGLTSYAEGGNRCDRSDTAPIVTASYPGVGSWRHFNLACSGATTNEITNPYTGREPAQTDQLRAVALAYRVKEIVVSIGGNDLQFGDIVRSCVRRYLTAFEPYCKTAWGDQSTELDTVGKKVTESLRDIQNTMRKAGYAPGDYRLVVQNYPSPLPPSDSYRYRETYARYIRGGCPFYNTDTDWARNTIVLGMTFALRRAAEAAGATFLDVQDALAGHELCNKNAQQATDDNSAAHPLDSQSAEWVRWVSYLRYPDALWASQGDNQEAIHPNAFGQLALGGCLTQLGDQAPPGSYSYFLCVNDGRNGVNGMQIYREH
ncbi:hypothetical protein AQI88_41635 [Streptomyces cellostaticus]|uniref:Endonuclease/exonuclease/phosphatase domain-containing protein n=1 Tax=Streptomyces cellostaticus TaxID=67285 RepID=A0A101N3A9_9ACTN|nr:hypothetical protein AQI88_41635 [Streptomyces cellostaticus]GHI10256.1 hypothetical protein Scel_85770 [Streptomyces cellostaticus]